LNGGLHLTEWVNEYLLRSSDKIGRLELGIRVEDDRPFPSMNVNEVGELRKVPHGKGDKCRYRDVRTDHVASALGFVQKGWSAFQHHDKSTRDADYLGIYDGLALEDQQHRRGIRRTIIEMMMKNEGIDGERAARNRLSKARRKSSGSGKRGHRT
jgi:hypothetical protein